MREQPHLREGVEYHAARLHPLELLQQRARHLRQFDLGRLEERVLLGEAEVLHSRGKLEHGKIGDVPSMRLGHGLQLLTRLRERDVEDAFAAAQPFDEELQTECCLARPGVALDEMEASGR